MKLKRLTNLILSAVISSSLIGCSSYALKMGNNGLFMEYYKDGSIACPKINNEGEKVWYYRMPINGTGYFVEGFSENKKDAKSKALILQKGIYLDGISEFFLDWADENENFFIDEKEYRNYHRVSYFR